MEKDVLINMEGIVSRLMEIEDDLITLNALILRDIKCGHLSDLSNIIRYNEDFLLPQLNFLVHSANDIKDTIGGHNE